MPENNHGSDTKSTVNPIAATPPPVSAIRNADPVQSAVLMLTKGMTDKSASAALQSLQGMAADKATETVKAAREVIVQTASFDHAKEMGQAYIRLNSLYTQAVAAKDYKTAFATQKELNKLIDVHKPDGFTPGSMGEDDGIQGELDLVQQHLEGLGLAPEGTSVPELARLAAAKIISLESNTG